MPRAHDATLASVYAHARVSALLRPAARTQLQLQVTSNTAAPSSASHADWQSAAMFFSYKQTQQPGAITRVMCCDEQETAAYNKDLLNLMPTHLAPSVCTHTQPLHT